MGLLFNRYMKIHLFHVSILVGILLTSIFAYLQLQGSPMLQFLVGLVAVVSYVSWGIMHHGIQKELHPKIVVEYVGIGFLAVLFLYWALF